MTLLRLAAMLLLLSVLGFGQRITPDQVAAFVKSSIETHQDDHQVAAYLQSLKLANRLDARGVEELQSLGAGPRTVAALKALMESSASLPEAKPVPVKEPVTAPQPTAAPADWPDILAAITDHARNYTANLPNYLCDQLTRREMDEKGGEDYRLIDTIQEQLTFFEQKEQYKVVMVNGKMQQNLRHEQLGGSVSSGEFGSMQAAIFQPETETEFHWERMGKLKGRLMYVFNYRVEKQIYTIHHQPSDRTIHVGYHGTIWADKDTRQVMRIKMDCDGIPASFPIQNVSLDLKYDFVPIGGQTYVVPQAMDLKTRNDRVATWNQAEFRLYRKYGTSSDIKFEDEKTPPKKP